MAKDYVEQRNGDYYITGSRITLASVAQGFLGDADLSLGIFKGVKRREPTIVFLTAKEADLKGVPDPEVLRLAASEGRILVSHDLATMPKHFREFVATQKSSGVLLISQST